MIHQLLLSLGMLRLLLLPTFTSQEVPSTSASEAHLSESVIIYGSKTEIFNLISDHEQTPKWIQKVESVKLIREGNPKNGKGAVREVDFRPDKWPTVTDEITAYTPNEGYKYVTDMDGIKKLHGSYKLKEQEDGGVLVCWDVYIQFKRISLINLIKNKFLDDFREIQQESLQKLKVIIESKEHPKDKALRP